MQPESKWPTGNGDTGKGSQYQRDWRIGEDSDFDGGSESANGLCHADTEELDGNDHKEEVSRSSHSNGTLPEMNWEVLHGRIWVSSRPRPRKIISFSP